MNNSALLIPLSHFERIFRVIHGFLVAFEYNPNNSCSFFSVIGAGILAQHYGFKAQACFGAAAFFIEPSKNIVFADAGYNPLRYSETGFHAWVQVEEVAIDFSSPLLPDLVTPANAPGSKRKMLQKTVLESAPSINELTTELPFYLLPDQIFSQRMLNEFCASEIHIDMLNQAIDWYIKPPRLIAESYLSKVDGGRKKTIFLSPLKVSETW